jgi:hypothetical protein
MKFCAVIGNKLVAVRASQPDMAVPTVAKRASSGWDIGGPRINEALWIESAEARKERE